MKRVFCLLLAVSLFLLTGCFGKSEGEETSSENPAPTSSKGILVSFLRLCHHCRMYI